jgi:protein NrfD
MSDRPSARAEIYDGPTYYGRNQVKPAPFNNWMVGTYIFLAGLSGAAQIISTLANIAQGRRAESVIRHGRYLALLAPTLGASLLIFDLHTPQRFYNMLRIFRPTSPMSFGSYILSLFGVSSGATAMLQFLADRARNGRIWRGLASICQIPAAIAGAGLATYTASLLSATSTPLWAAAPRGLAARFATSSMASGAAALSLLEPRQPRGASLDRLTVAALAAELTATMASTRTYREKGVAGPLEEGAWAVAEKYGVVGLGVLAPLGVHATSLVLTRNVSAPRTLSNAASLAVLVGSALMRIAIMAAGDESARRPEISFRFTQPDNLPVRR